MLMIIPRNDQLLAYQSFIVQPVVFFILRFYIKTHGKSFLIIIFHFLFNYNVVK